MFNLYADVDARSMTPSRNARSYTLRSVPSSPGRSFFYREWIKKSFPVDSGQGRIDSVKINPSLLMMRKCTVTHWWNVGFTLRVPIWNVGTLK